jgi:tetratricopeptide (TPR) repeat protein
VFRSSRYLALLVLIFVQLSAGTAGAHGDLDELLAHADRAIAAHPESTDAWLRRAELRSLHGEHAAAARDLARARELEPDRAELDLYRGRLELAAGDTQSAADALAKFTARSPEHVGGHVLYAEALAARDQEREAVGAYARALELRPNPAIYLARANLSATWSIDEALAGLDEARDVLGPIAPLELRAIELEAADGRFDAALARVARLEALPGRSEVWTVRGAELLERAGRYDDALQCWADVIAAIEALPDSRRRTPATAEREARARAARERLAADPAVGR